MSILLTINNTSDINNKSPFIVLHGKQGELNKYIEKKSSNIYRIKSEAVSSVFNKYNLNYSHFIPASDIYIDSHNPLIKLLFINKSIIKYPIDYNIIDKYKEGKIWEPLGIAGYKSIGVLYGHRKPKLTEIPMIPVELLIQIRDISTYSNSIKKYNEYNSLSNDIHGYWTIDRERMSTSVIENFLFLQSNDKYLTKDNNNKLILSESSPKLIKHTINGDIMIDNMCLSDDMTFTNCDNKINKKWDIINDNIINKSNNQCLINYNNKLQLGECTNNKIKISRTSNNDISNGWKPVLGRFMTLKSNPNPWYKNKKSTEKIQFNTNLSNQDIPVSPFDNKNNINAIAINNKINNNELIKEGFGTTKYDIKYIIIILIALLIIYIVYKKKHLLFK